MNHPLNQSYKLNERKCPYCKQDVGLLTAKHLCACATQKAEKKKKQSVNEDELSEYHSSDTSRVLEILTANALYGDGWVAHPYLRLRVMWHSRVADLRSRGCKIECRRVVDSEGAPDYQYRLVNPLSPEVRK